MEPQAQSSDIQAAIHVERLAIDCNGRAVEDRLVGREANDTIRAYRRSELQMHEALRKLRKEGVQNLFRTSLAYTEREQGSATTDTFLYLVVGYAFRDRSFISRLQKAPQNTSFGMITYVHPWDENALVLAVTPIEQIQWLDPKMYALLCPRRGLCTPFRLQSEHVLYRPEFRVPNPRPDLNPFAAWEDQIYEIVSEQCATLGIEKKARETMSIPACRDWRPQGASPYESRQPVSTAL